MKRPAFQFYVKDWRTDAALRRCSPAARGAWMDVLCVMHESDEYGVLRWPLKEIASVAGVPVALLRELASKNVLKGADKGAEDFWHTPTHAGKEGKPVCLIEVRDGPCWYSARFVRDEWIRNRRGGGTQFTADNQPTRSPNGTPTGAPIPPIGEDLGDGAASASAVALKARSSPSLGNPVSPSVPAAPAPTEAGRACLLMRKAGCGFRANPSNPSLLAALAEGVTPETLADTVAEGLARAPPVDEPFSWAIKTARNRHAAGPQPVAATPTGSPHVHHAPRLSAAERVAANNRAAEERERLEAEGRRAASGDDADAVEPDD